MDERDTAEYTQDIRTEYEVRPDSSVDSPIPIPSPIRGRTPGGSPGGTPSPPLPTLTVPVPSPASNLIPHPMPSRHSTIRHVLGHIKCDIISRKPLLHTFNEMAQSRSQDALGRYALHNCLPW